MVGAKESQSSQNRLEHGRFGPKRRGAVAFASLHRSRYNLDGKDNRHAEFFSAQVRICAPVRKNRTGAHLCANRCIVFASFCALSEKTIQTFSAPERT